MTNLVICPLVLNGTTTRFSLLRPVCNVRKYKVDWIQGNTSIGGINVISIQGDGFGQGQPGTSSDGANQILGNFVWAGSAGPANTTGGPISYQVNAIQPFDVQHFDVKIWSADALPNSPFQIYFCLYLWTD